MHGAIKAKTINIISTYIFDELLMTKKLHYQQQGSGADIILIHGLLGSLENLNMVAKNLKENYRVTNIDVRNHGLSFHKKTMTYKELAQDIVELMADLGIERSHILGHSMGGKIAMELPSPPKWLTQRYPPSLSKSRSTSSTQPPSPPSSRRKWRNSPTRSTRLQTNSTRPAQGRLTTPKNRTRNFGERSPASPSS